MHDSVWQDVRFSLRALARRPGFTFAALLSLGIGIAAVTVVMSVVNTALFRPLPGVTRTERLVEIHRSARGEPTDVTYEVFRALKANSALDELAAFAIVSASVSVGDGTHRARRDGGQRGLLSAVGYARGAGAALLSRGSDLSARRPCRRHFA